MNNALIYNPLYCWQLILPHICISATAFVKMINGYIQIYFRLVSIYKEDHFFKYDLLTYANIMLSTQNKNDNPTARVYLLLIVLLAVAVAIATGVTACSDGSFWCIASIVIS